MSRPGYVYHLREPVGYQEGWDMQRRLADAVSRGAMPDTVLLLEHAPVITLGRRTEPGELHVPTARRSRSSRPTAAASPPTTARASSSATRSST